MPAEHTTTRLGIPYPDANGKILLGNTDIQELAERLDAICATITETAALKEKTLTVKTRAGNYTAVPGELGIQETAKGVTTLPSATPANQLVAVHSRTTECSITASGTDQIVGDIIISSPGNTVKLAAQQHIMLMSDGAGHWMIVAGEPRQEQAYTTWASGFENEEREPNVARPTLVICTVENFAAGEWRAGLFIGGVEVSIAGAEGRIPYTFIVPAGKKWKVVATLNKITTKFSYLTL